MASKWIEKKQKSLGIAIFLVRKAGELLLSINIDPSDDRAIKTNCEDRIRRLEAKMVRISAQPLVRIEIKKLFNKVEKGLLSLTSCILMLM
ncbi:hypothetical protein ACXZ1K_12915 [Pedobacter sp. PWIIR3]